MATEPSNVIWQNWQPGLIDFLLRRAVAIGAAVILVLASTYIVVGVSDAAQAVSLNVDCGATSDEWHDFGLGAGITCERVRTDTCNEDYMDFKVPQVNTTAFYSASWDYKYYAAFSDVSEDQWSNGVYSGDSSDECAGKVCYDCYCKEMGYTSYVRNTDELGVYCKDYWHKVILQVVFLLVVALTKSTVDIIVPCLAVDAGLQVPCLAVDAGLQVPCLAVDAGLQVSSVLIANNFIVPILIHSTVEGLSFIPLLFNGKYTDFSAEWYQVVGSSLYLGGLINVAAWAVREPLVAFQLWAKARLLNRWSLTQRTTDRLYSPPNFRLGERTGTLLAGIATGMVFSCAMPLFPFIGAAILGAQYFADRYMLLRVSQMPVMYGVEMADAVLKTLPVFVVVHLALAFWMISYWEIDGYRLTDYTPANEEDVWNLRSRLNNATTLPISIMLFLGPSLMMGQALFLYIRKTVFEISTAQLEGLPLFSEARRGDLIEGYRSYQMIDNPSYQLLLEEASESTTNMSTGRDRAETHWTSKQALADVYVAGKDGVAGSAAEAAKAAESGPNTGPERPESIVVDAREAEGEAENATDEQLPPNPPPRTVLSGYYQRKDSVQAGDSPAIEMTNVEQASESAGSRNSVGNGGRNSDVARMSRVTTNVNPLVERIEKENIDDSAAKLWDNGDDNDDDSDESW
eukprot:gene4956-6040_t